MAAGELAAELVRRQVEGVLKSPGFERNERLSRFLCFIVERHLEGRNAELKESVIGVEVFGRSPDYNPKTDPIVRTEARRLRARLSKFYENEGGAAAVIIELPKGGYVPAVRLRETSEPFAPKHAPSAIRFARVRIARLAFATLAILAGAFGWQRLSPAHSSRPYAGSPASNAYLRARDAERVRACEGVELSLELFEQAIAQDGSFAPAYAGVAAMEAVRSGFERFSPLERAAMIAKGWAAARKAMQLDSRLPDANDALGMMQARQAQWRRAESSFRRAIALDPGEPLWRDHFVVFMLLPVGRIEEAITQLRKVEELAPKELETHWALSIALRAAGRFDDADFHCRNAVENERQLSACWADTLTRQRKSADAVRILETAWQGQLLSVGGEALGIAYARAGRRHDAEKIAAMVPRPAAKALIYTALGDNDHAFELLEHMIPMGPTRIGRDLISPDFAALRGDARFQAIRGKLGLPERMPAVPAGF